LTATVSGDYSQPAVINEAGATLETTIARINLFGAVALLLFGLAQIVLLGANVGTAWIVASGIGFSPLIIHTGIVLYRSGSSKRQGGGTALIGIGVMLMSLPLLGTATERPREGGADSLQTGSLHLTCCAT
jgi:Na+/phosphate symporter